MSMFGDGLDSRGAEGVHPPGAQVAQARRCGTWSSS